MNWNCVKLTALLCTAMVTMTIVTPTECTDRDEEIRIVNVFDDFLTYYKQCKRADETTRIEKWDELLEFEHEDFFEHVIYRKKEGKDRDEYKEWCIEQFWTEIAPKMADISKLNVDIEDQITTVVKDFLKLFPDFEATTDYYVTISFSFRGKVVDIGEKNVFAIGLEHFESDGQDLKITIAHELFHLYHFQFFSASGALYRMVWAEGLAVYASAKVVPGYRRSAYLGFSGEKMNQCAEMLPLLAADLRKNMGNNDPVLKRVYMGAEDNDTKVPPEAGYYVGLLIIESLARETPLKKLARMEPKEVYRTVEKELKRLEKSTE